MAVQAHPDRLMGCLAALPDPRRRQGRRYPLSAILGLVLMGMLHGRDSLRGGWVWARQHWGLLWRPLGGVSADGKVLRGSKRDELPALHVVSLVAHDCASILAQRQAADGDEVAALLTLLTAVPLAGRIISMDAGLLTGAVTQTITRQEGEYIGMVKGNNPEVLAVLDEWVATAVLSPLRRNGSAPAGRAGPACATATETVSVRSAT